MSRPEPARQRVVRGLVFDKDGTLVDFHATWDPLVEELIERLAAADPVLGREAADALAFDLGVGSARPGSPLLSETNAQLADRLAPVFGRPAGDQGFLAEVESALTVPDPVVREVEGATRVLERLVAMRVPLALATNDSEASARTHLDRLGWSTHFSVVLGYDSGHGAKPDPGMVHAAANGLGLSADEVAVVGDSWHDLEAARRAGALAVLVGGGDDLVRHADVVVGSLDAVADLVTAD